ncbi:MAG TPA: ATP-binding cassette domain-containing protein [Tissierellales bacterium]|nr:ATP-binding cassette domain-containing protein [Tissierellales bacterium]
MFRIKNVRYKNILEVPHFEISQNKITTIVGESGSGKTTLLKLLNKMINPTEGHIYYKNKNIKEREPVELRREVVMLPQNPVIFSGTIKDNLLIGLKFSEKPLVEDKELKDIMEIIYLKKGLDSEVDKLSGGEKQRLALGRTLLLSPEVFLFDEPSSALDEGSEDVVIRNIVEYVKEKEKTLIMVTHSIKIAKEYSDFIVEMKDGKIIGNGEI